MTREPVIMLCGACGAAMERRGEFGGWRTSCICRSKVYFATVTPVPTDFPIYRQLTGRVPFPILSTLYQYGPLA